jgi:hypothetical protein
VSDQHEDDGLRRWAREQAEIERQTDALVLRTMTAMVTAAEDLKSKLRRDTESIVEDFQRTKRGLENEISLSGAERQRFRREVEQERESILSEAKAEAQEIVQSAEREREQLLREVRSMEQRLRALEGQIRSVLGLEAAVAPAGPAASVSPTPAPTPSAAPSPVPAPVATTPRPPIRTLGAAPAPTPAPDATVAVPPTEAPASPIPVAPVADAPVATAPVAPSAPDEADWPADDDDEGPATVAATAPAFAPAPTPPAVFAPEPAPIQEPAASPPSTHLRLVELIFDGVPGYQQASALERALNDLLPDEDVDIVEFERGQLILSVQATDLDALARQLVATSPASLELDTVAGDRATFRCV